MKKEKSTFLLFLALNTALLFALSAGYMLYTCNGVKWLFWAAQSPYPTILGFLLLFGLPFWFGAKHTALNSHRVFLYGMGLNLGTGLTGNAISIANWQLFLTKCMPEKFTDQAFHTMIIASWFALPFGVILGGITAWIGYRLARRVISRP